MKRIIFFIATITLLLSFSTVAYAKNQNAGKKWNNQPIAQQEQKHKEESEDEDDNEQQVQKYKQDSENEDNDEQQEQKSQKVAVTSLAKAGKVTEKKVKEEKAKELKKEKEEKAREQKANKGQETKAKKLEFKINGSPVIKIGRFTLPIRPITKGMNAKVTYEKENSVLTVVKDDTTIVFDFKNKTVTVNGVEDNAAKLFTAKNNSKMTVLVKYIADKLGVRVKVEKHKITVEVPINPHKKIKITSAVYTVQGTAASVSGGAISVSGSAISVSGSSITIGVNGACTVGKSADVTKITLKDTATGATYQLTSASTGVASAKDAILITLGDADILGLKNFGTTLSLTVAAGPLLSDATGKTSLSLAAEQTVPVTVNVVQ